MAYVLTCGDEGVQINEGTRLAFLGSGYKLPGFDQVIPLLKAIFSDKLNIAASEENDWLKQQFDVATWEQTNASAQQHIEALADRLDLTYIKIIPFADPKELGGGIKGHMVRPHGIHIANKICFTVAGGEQVYNLGQYVISADWVAQADDELIRTVLDPQIAFYESLSGGKQLERTVQSEGSFDEATVTKNLQRLESLGYITT